MRVCRRLWPFVDPLLHSPRGFGSPLTQAFIQWHTSAELPWLLLALGTSYLVKKYQEACLGNDIHIIVQTSSFDSYLQVGGMRTKSISTGGHQTMATLLPAAPATAHHTEARQPWKLHRTHTLRSPASGNIKEPHPTTSNRCITASAFGKEDRRSPRRDDAPGVTGPSGESTNLPVKASFVNMAQCCQHEFLRHTDTLIAALTHAPGACGPHDCRKISSDHVMPL